MKYFSLMLFLFMNACMAASMTGFGARYYDEVTETYAEVHKTDKDLIPEIVIGSKKYWLERSALEDISIFTGATINKDNQAMWICLESNSINYWFISDNEMGNGGLTAVAIAKDSSPCITYKGKLQVSVKAPLLTRKESVSSFFAIPLKNKDIVMYYKDVEKSDEYTQGNSIMYYLRGKGVQGVFISQTTTR
ncbi:hypothetical protein [Enterobacter mori]|uniref:hypothetical protein n=1 Tax=Enterobacter mori TaxID=539813 RepID=UPI001B8D3023|nr:hypothetical protein [Enterobacter mori]